MEFHEIPHRPGWKRGGTVRTDKDTGSHRSGNRKAAVIIGGDVKPDEWGKRLPINAAAFVHRGVGVPLWKGTSLSKNITFNAIHLYGLLAKHVLSNRREKTFSFPAVFSCPK